MKHSSASLSFNETVAAITEFIEVAVHTILFLRQVYPPDLFVRRRKYSTPVYQARHPEIGQYITGALTAFGEELAASNVLRLIVVIKNGKSQVPYERFIFGMQRVVDVNEDNKHLGVRGGMSSEALSQYFRSFLVKLSMLESTLGDTDLGEDASFAILMELRNKLPETMGDDENAPPPWLPADIEHTTQGAPDNAELHMIRAVDTGIINLALAVQESDAKLNPEKYQPSKPEETQPNTTPNATADENSLPARPHNTSSAEKRTAVEFQPIGEVAASATTVEGSQSQSAQTSSSDRSAVLPPDRSNPSESKRKSVSFQLETSNGEDARFIEYQVSK